MRDHPDISTCYVPFRNAHRLSIAISWGKILGAHRIFIGSIEVDCRTSC